MEDRNLDPRPVPHGGSGPRRQRTFPDRRFDPLAVLAVIALATGLLWLGSTLWTSVDVIDDA
jgi:hypothetical protein